MNMIELNESELSLIQGGDALNDYLNNPYLNRLGGAGGSGYSPPYIPVDGGFPGGIPNFY